MSKFLLGLILLSSLCSASCNSTESKHNTKVDQKGGYKDLRLDAPLTSFANKAGFTLSEDNQCERKKKYVVESDPYMTIGSIRFDKVELEFVRDSLCSTTLVKSTNSDDIDALNKMYRAEFGEPTKSETNHYGDAQTTTTSWDGDKYRIHIISGNTMPIMITYSSDEGTSRSFEEEQACEERKLKKGQSEL